MNIINHKCPCCGYEVRWGQKNDGEGGFDIVVGDEPFIVIENGVGKSTTFETDKFRGADYDDPLCERVYLLGCPNCSTVSFQIW